MTGFQRLKYHIADDLEEVGTARGADTFRGPSHLEDAPVGPFNSDEAAARYFLERLLERDARPSMRSMVAPDEPGSVPGMLIASQQELPAVGSRLVRFDQTSREVPVFGGEAVVQLDGQRALVSADVRVGEVPDIGIVPSVDAGEALSNLARMMQVEVSLADIPTPTLEFFHEQGADRWHLAWHLRQVPALPPEARSREGHGMGASFRQRHVSVDYLVDAHSGDLLYYFSNSPTIVTPTKLTGVDESDASLGFLGTKAEGLYVLSDALGRVRTFDLQLGDIDLVAPPSAPVSQTDPHFGPTRRAVVTAHSNGALVQNFYKSVLQRFGIDDQGMELISVVNCVCQGDQDPPEWRNACWWKGRMWYGQVTEAGRLVSLARYLDVVAHEITHGVIETSSNLVYRDESGALNESFADVMGVIVANWHQASNKDDPATWNWAIGDGLRPGGKPLRNFSNPASLGQPDHMDNFVRTPEDFGGVHANSNIHNKAIHALLESRGPDGSLVVSVRDSVVIAYLVLVQLTKTATFSDAREKMLDVVRVYFAGDEVQRDAAVAAVRSSYGAVGIE